MTRAIRIGVLVPPGNPTVEPEMYRAAPADVSLHFTRMVAGGTAGAQDGMEARVRSALDNLDAAVDLLVQVRPQVMTIALTAMSYLLGAKGEADLFARVRQRTGVSLTSAFAGAVAAFAHLGVRRIAIGSPYSETVTAQCRAALEARGFEVVGVERLVDAGNVYEQSSERAFELARSVDRSDAEAIYIPGTGFPTMPILARLEADRGKPAVSSTAATLWNALRLAGCDAAVPGHGRLLAGGAASTRGKV